MAKDKQDGDVVQVPRSEWEQLKSNLAELLHDKRVREEREDSLHEKAVLDRRQQEREAQSMRSAQERTQEIADRTYGTNGQRWRCYLDSTREDGKAGPDVSIFFPLELCANSDLEAQARYQKLMGITKHDYRIVAAPLGETVAAA